MNKVVLQVETELDASAAPRVFGYLGGLGHIPLQAALRRDGSDSMVIEVHFNSQVAAAELISAKLGEMPFVLTANLAVEAAPSGNTNPAKERGELNAGEGAQQSAAIGVAEHPRLDVAALRLAAAQRGRAVHHRSWMHLNA